MKKIIYIILCIFLFACIYSFNQEAISKIVSFVFITIGVEFLTLYYEKKKILYKCLNKFNEKYYDLYVSYLVMRLKLVILPVGILFPCIYEMLRYCLKYIYEIGNILVPFVISFILMVFIEIKILTIFEERQFCVIFSPILKKRGNDFESDFTKQELEQLKNILYTKSHVTTYNENRKEDAYKETYTIDDIYALPEGERAELIDGQIYYLATPSRTHQKLNGFLSRTIGNYIESKNGECEVYAAPFAVFLNNDDINYVEPDISVICDPSKLDEKGCHGAPDWIIEIVSPGSKQMDYYKKLLKYSTAGVREYWIVDFEKNRITVYDFQRDSLEEYAFSDKVKAGIYDDFEIDFSEISMK